LKSKKKKKKKKKNKKKKKKKKKKKNMEIVKLNVIFVFSKYVYFGKDDNYFRYDSQIDYNMCENQRNLSKKKKNTWTRN